MRPVYRLTYLAQEPPSGAATMLQHGFPEAGWARARLVSSLTAKMVSSRWSLALTPLPFLAPRQHSLSPVLSPIHPSVHGHLWRVPMAVLENTYRHAEWTSLELSSLFAPACLFCRPAHLGESAWPMWYNHGGNRGGHGTDFRERYRSKRGSQCCQGRWEGSYSF